MDENIRLDVTWSRHGLELLEVMVGELHGVGGRDHGGQCVLELLVLVIGLIRA